MNNLRCILSPARAVRLGKLLCIQLVLVFVVVACGGGDTTKDPTTTVTSLETALPTTQTGNITPSPTVQATSTSATVQATSTSGVSANCAPTTEQFVNLEQYKKRLDCAVEYFDWPEAYQLDLNTVYRLLDENRADAEFEKGYEFNFLLTWNVCAWFSEWIDARGAGTTAREQAALHVMTQVLPNYLSAIPNFPAAAEVIGLSDGLRKIAENAALGNPADAQRYIQGNCSVGYDPWVKTS